MSHSRAKQPVVVEVCRVPGRPEDLRLPEPATNGSAGMDLRAALAEAQTLAPGERCLVPTGLAMAIPTGYEGQIRPRSGLALRHGLTVLNAPGTVDSDYRGEVCVLLINLGQQPATIEPGARIAQLLVARVSSVTLVPVPRLPDTERGAGGFGHTGR